MLALFAVFLLVGVLPIGAIGVASVVSGNDGGTTAASATPTVIDVELSEFAVSGRIEEPEGPVTLRVTNAGTAQHDLTIESLGADTPMLSAGQTYDLELGELLEPVEVLPDGTKVFELTSAITPWEVLPGKVVDAWSYNGIVPGPQMRLDVGDKVQVRYTNDLPISADIHWHGIRVPNSQDGVSPYTQDAVMPGETYTYEFQVTEPMVGMYHAHHAGQHAIPNGMFASIIVGDMELPRGRTISGVGIPADLEVAQEMPMVLNDAGVIGLTLDGKSFPATAPVVVDQGDWVLVHYYNGGGQTHPMHLHGFPQLVTARDGIPLESPYWADTVNVAPGERWSVLINARDAGTWVWHCHIINHVESDTGMFGMVTAVVVNPA